MNGFAFRKHTVFEWQGAQHRIERLHPNGDIWLERLDSRQLVSSTRTELLAAYADGSLSALSKAASNTSEPAIAGNVYTRPLIDLTPKVRQELQRRQAYVTGILSYGQPLITNAYLAPRLREIAKKLGDTRPPSAPTFWRWIRRYQHERDFRALIPRHDRRGSRQPRQSDRILALAEEAVTEAHKLSRHTTMTVIETILKGKVDRENIALHNGTELLIMPSKRTLYRLLKRVEAYEAFSLRNGNAEAERKFRVLNGSATSSRILERVECDHTVLDLFLIDERTQLPLGRPTLTVCIDHYSKMPLGYYLSYQAPSVAAVVGALRHAILPKPAAQSDESSAKNAPIHAWTCHGLPQALVVDNGLEFHANTLQSIAMDLGMAVLFCPKYQPWFKGSVERFLGCISRRFLHTLPGTSFSRWHHRGDYDPLKHAVLTLGDFKQMFEKWLLDDYAQTVHCTTKETPWASWHQGLQAYEPTLPRSRHTLAQRIGQVSHRKLGREGIFLEGIRYSGPELLPILRAHGPGIEVRIVFDPDDLGEIHVWAPDQADPITVKALDWEYAHELTQLQNQLIRKMVQERGAAQTNVQARQEARLALIDMMREQMTSRKLGDRKRAAKLQGSSSRDPQKAFPSKTSVPRKAVSQTAADTSAATSKRYGPLADADEQYAPSLYTLLRSAHELKTDGGGI